jgi:hypothetical protein
MNRVETERGEACPDQACFLEKDWRILRTVLSVALLQQYVAAEKHYSAATPV